MRKLPLLLASALALHAQLLWTHHPQDGRVELTENGRPYLTYNAGPQLKPGAPADRQRCCYIYPLLTPGGVNPLDDFPADHYHHRGIFWAWPVVETPSSKSDLWMIRNIEARLEKIDQISGNTLQVRNGWYVNGKKIVAESVRITAHPSRDGERRLQIDLTFTAENEPVTLKGSQEKGKSYGGLSARFAPRTQTKIRTNAGPLAKDDDLTAYQWAELSALYDGKPASLRITPGPANEGAPYQWCLRNYGFLGASFPGRTETVQSYTLRPGHPLTLSFTVTVADATR